jgi:hypothetical protein
VPTGRVLPWGWHTQLVNRFFLLCAMSPPLMISLLTAAGLAGFWLFYRSVNFFDRI